MGEDLIFLLIELLIQKNRYNVIHDYVRMYNLEYHKVRAYHDPCIKCECYEIEKLFIKYEKPDDVEAILKETPHMWNKNKYKYIAFGINWFIMQIL